MQLSPGLDSYFNFSRYIHQKIQQNQPKKQKLKLARHGKHETNFDCSYVRVHLGGV